jgi:DNA-3-methyladenine glycosylase
MAVDLSLPAPVLAPRLLGCRLRRGPIEALITETEAYQGTADRACHASRGMTPRNAVMFGPPGHLYVYFCYGMHHLLNLVCDRPGVPAAVLIRSLRIIAGVGSVGRRIGTGRCDDRACNGPAKVCRALGLDRSHSGLRLGVRSCPLRLLGRQGPPPCIRRGPRVGVGYAGEPWISRPWRFWIDGFPVVKG